VLTVINQSPQGGAFVAEPIVFDEPLLLPRAHKRRRGRFSRLRQPVGFHQEKSALPEPEKRFAALSIGALAEHVIHCFLLPNILRRALDSVFPATRVPESSCTPPEVYLIRNCKKRALTICFCRPFGSTCRLQVAADLASALIRQLLSALCQNSTSALRIISISWITKMYLRRKKTQCGA